MVLFEKGFKVSKVREVPKNVSVASQVGLRLERLRLVLEISQENMAACLGMNAQEYAEVEAGKLELYTDELWALSKILNLNIAQFYWGDEL